MSYASLKFVDYQNATGRTAIYPADKGIEYCVLGLTNEAGEVAGVLKKHYRDGTPTAELKDKLAKEIGDVLWYVSQLCAEIGIPMAYVAQANLDKLQDRQARGVLGGSGDNR